MQVPPGSDEALRDLVLRVAARNACQVLAHQAPPVAVHSVDHRVGDDRGVHSAVWIFAIRALITRRALS